MDKKFFLTMTAVAAMFAACSNDADPVQEPAEVAKANTEVAQQIPVAFDAYNNRATTRAVTDLTALQTNGFGVFAYYTNNDDYDGQQIPNFMWNQQVTYADPAWDYDPVKYWPNEFSDASAEENDRISFFAYGPYKAAVTSNGKVTGVTNNIIGFSRNNYAGDPLVKYVVDFDPSSSIDLVWGTVPTTPDFEFFDGATTYPSTQKGKPWLNVKRPKYTNDEKEKVNFNFRHALASLNVQVDQFEDVATYAADKNVNGKTRIWIRSITFTGFTTEGALNLNNTDENVALWMGINGEELVTGESVTFHDGRKDGKEATASAGNEKMTVLNPNLIQSLPYKLATAAGNDDANQAYAVDDLLATNDADYLPGVVSIAQNLFDPTRVVGYTKKTVIKATEPIYVIPTGDDVYVTIAYDVETADPSLATKLSDNVTLGSSISNVITKKVTFTTVGDSKLHNGYKYIVKLHLGMNSVKFDAAVQPWETDDNGAVDLPGNN